MCSVECLVLSVECLVLSVECLVSRVQDVEVRVQVRVESVGKCPAGEGGASAVYKEGGLHLNRKNPPPERQRKLSTMFGGDTVD